MTSSRRSAKPASRWMGFVGAAFVVVAPVAAHAQPADLYYERAEMTAADQRCGLFAPDVAAALAAATAQARGAALRAGPSDASLRQPARRAQAKAAAPDCPSGDLATAAARVKSAFTGYAKMTRLTYAGDVAGWSADKNLGRAVRWSLAQETAFGTDRMVFGLAGREGAQGLVASASFADGARPYAARLVLRDPARAPQPYLARYGAGATVGLALAQRLPPALAQKAFVATARAPSDPELLPHLSDGRPAQGGWAFRFPDTAIQDLARLDPRESVAVDFLFSGGATRRAYVEVGDFAAGRAFLAVAIGR